ncbi:DUF2933 domain-containing protein [Sporolactobacillus terrae]|nr:DUF2933 domain-containing protein [Sporolactobacillus terrae]
MEKRTINHQESPNHSHRFMMLFCLIIPIAVITGFFFSGGFSSGAGAVFILLAALICPLMHLFMMLNRMKKGQKQHHA